VTNADWKDMWLHEGFGSYMQALYIEDRDGAARYREFMESMRPRIGNRKPVAPETSTSAQEIYAGHDIYFKGAWILHTLRWVIGDEAFFRALRRMAYPDPALARTTDGRAARFATTTDFRTIAETEAGRDLGWFFEAYLRTAALPRLVADRSPGRLELRWESPDGRPFPMPVEIGLGDRTVRVAMEDGTGSVTVPEGVEPVLDPEDWLLKARER
jgi:aminopeptidase N